MVRGNWQKRVERAETRRQNAKQQKQSRQNRSNYKQYVLNDLFPFLDKHNESMTLQVWTDTCPPMYQDYYRDMSNSNNHDDDDLVTKTTNKRTFVPKKQRKKKAHPRSNFKQSHPKGESLNDEMTMNVDDDKADLSTFLCQKHFFTNKCNDYPSSCPYVHFISKTNNGQHTAKSLAQVLLGKDDNKEGIPLSSNKTNDQRKQEPHIMQLQKSQEIIENDFMEMLYAHETITIPFDNNITEDVKPSQELGQILAQNSCPMASLVYVVRNGSLIFDRNRGGLLIDNDGNTSLPEPTQYSNTVTVNSSTTNQITILNENENDESVILHLPTSIWQQYILEYLPVQYTLMSLNRVCKAWNVEINSCSEDLWKRYLERCNFPRSLTNNLTFEEDFKIHYNAVRDIAAVANASSEIESIHTAFSNKKKKKNQNDLAILQRAAASTHSLEYLHTCYDYYQLMKEYRDMITHVRFSGVLPVCAISRASWIQIWDETSFLVAYPHDCSIQLWNIVSFGNKSIKTEMKSMFTSFVSPIRQKKKKQTATSILLSIAMDENFVVSCFHVENECKNSSFRGELELDNTGVNEYIDPCLLSSRPWFTIIPRESLLEGSSDEASNLCSTSIAQHRHFLDENILKIYDIKKVILDYFFEFKETNHLETEYTFGSGRLRQIYNYVKGAKLEFEERTGDDIAAILLHSELASLLDETFLSPSILSSIMACDGNNGYFLCVVSLFAISYDDTGDVIDDPCPVIILFSTEEEKISWIYDLSSFPAFRGLTKVTSSQDNVRSVRSRKNSKTFTHFVLDFHQLVVPFHVENWTGIVHLHKRVDSVINEEFLQLHRQNGWSIDNSHNIDCAMTLRHENNDMLPLQMGAVRAINWKKDDIPNARSASIIISEIPITDIFDTASFTVLGSDIIFDEERHCRTINFDCSSIISMESIRDEYLLLFCCAKIFEINRISVGRGDGTVNDAGGDEDDHIQEGINGLMDEIDNVDIEDDLNDDDSSTISNVAILVHIPSGMEICRYALLDDETNENTLAFFTFKCLGDTLVLELEGKGIMMTGNNTRDCINQSILKSLEISGNDIDDNFMSPKSAKKKKKKRNANKNNKKDGFARGMSLRG